MVNWSPEEALPAIASRERTPLLLSEGLHWVLQQPGILERNLCFMTIGSRLKKPSGAYDSRTPALWISNGTGRDGRERKRSEEHTSELQSRGHLVCRLLLEKKQT